MPRLRPDAGGAPKFLAVSDFGTGAVEVLDHNYNLKKTITSGLSGPAGDWYDAAGNLYVTDYNNNTVQEYAPGSSSPTFTYSSGMKDPLDVATDEAGNVYVTDHNFSNGGFVAEYAQGSNTVLHQCSAGSGSGLQGIAVDERGDVFVSVNTTGGPGIVEYKHGLNGCKQTVLGVKLRNTGGLQLDNKNDLVACDQISGTVDIVAPPYTTVTGTITGFSDPYNVALNKANTLVFVTEPSKKDVVVDNYPSGTNVTTLGAANGLKMPAGVAADPPEN